MQVPAQVHRVHAVSTETKRIWPYTEYGLVLCVYVSTRANAPFHINTYIFLEIYKYIQMVRLISLLLCLWIQLSRTSLRAVLPYIGGRGRVGVVLRNVALLHWRGVTLAHTLLVGVMRAALVQSFSGSPLWLSLASVFPGP